MPQAQKPRYHAFISYVRAEADFAARLQSGLHSFAKPWYRLRAVRTFRDETSLQAGDELVKEIRSALDQSEFLIVLASKAAAASKWVNREVEHWVKTRGFDSIIIVLLNGTIDWDHENQKINSTLTDALPKCLLDLPYDPARVDLTWASTPRELSRLLGGDSFRSALAAISARLRNQPKDELFSDDRRQHLRSWTVAVVALTLVIIAIALSIVFALRAQAQRIRAESARRAATAQQLTTIFNDCLNERRSF